MDAHHVRTSVNSDRFSKDYKNIFKDAGHRLSSMFIKSTPQIEPNVSVSNTAPAFKRFRSPKRLPSNTKLSGIEMRTTAILANREEDEKMTSKRPHGISSKEWYVINCKTIEIICRVLNLT